MKAARHEKNGAMMATCMKAAALPCLTCSQHLSRFLLSNHTPKPRHRVVIPNRMMSASVKQTK